MLLALALLVYSSMETEMETAPSGEVAVDSSAPSSEEADISASVSAAALAVDSAVERASCCRLRKRC